MSIIAIDFEASCLPRHGRSFPIEVGIADAQGRSRVWLIKPLAEWRDWDWTVEAQGLHGITYEDLLRDGLPPEVVARELKQAIVGHRPVADSNIDFYWLATLTRAAAMPAFAKIDLVGTIFDELGSTSEEILAAQDDLDRQSFRRHRADHDARWLIALIGMVAEASASRRNTVDIPPGTADDGHFRLVGSDHCHLTLCFGTVPANLRGRGLRCVALIDGSIHSDVRTH